MGRDGHAQLLFFSKNMNNLEILIHEYRKKCPPEFSEVAFVSGVSALANYLLDDPESDLRAACDAIMGDVGDFIAEITK